MALLADSAAAKGLAGRDRLSLPPMLRCGRLSTPTQHARSAQRTKAVEVDSESRESAPNAIPR